MSQTTMRFNDEAVTLQCTTGGSFKEYHARIILAQGLYQVETQWGPIGGSLQSGYKPNSPVPYHTALVEHAKIVKAKLAKGYVKSAGRVLSPQVPPAPAVILPKLDTPKGSPFAVKHVPHLLVALSDENQLKDLLVSSDWTAQEKKDGKRITLQVAGPQVIAFNKLGAECAMPGEILASVRELQAIGADGYMLDGELVGQTLHCFDALIVDGVDLRNERFDHRYAALDKLLAGFRSVGLHQNLQLVPAQRGAEAKQELLRIVKAQGREGLVFKKDGGYYVPGRATLTKATQLKWKITESVSAVVLSHSASKRSVGVGLASAAGAMVKFGNVTVPPNAAMPNVGSVVEVEYLYCYEGGSLIQPVFKGPRDDVTALECVVSQITRYKRQDEVSENDA